MQSDQYPRLLVRALHRVRFESPGRRRLWFLRQYQRSDLRNSGSCSVRLTVIKATLRLSDELLQSGDGIRRRVTVRLHVNRDLKVRLGGNRPQHEREQRTVFKTLVEDVRRELALRYLADGRTRLTDVAFLVGYSELSAFGRAFHRWTGSTPLAMRRSLTAASTSRA